jgi:hypothetical protein
MNPHRPYPGVAEAMYAAAARAQVMGARIQTGGWMERDPIGAHLGSQPMIPGVQTITVPWVAVDGSPAWALSRPRLAPPSPWAHLYEQLRQGRGAGGLGVLGLCPIGSTRVGLDTVVQLGQVAADRAGHDVLVVHLPDSGALSGVPAHARPPIPFQVEPVSTLTPHLYLWSPADVAAEQWTWAEREAFSTALAGWTARFRDVIVRLPRLQSPGAVDFARRCASVLVMARAGKTRRRDLQEASRLLAQVHVVGSCLVTEDKSGGLVPYR